MYANTLESKVNRMIGKKQLIAFVMLVALTVFGVLNLNTVRLSAYESPAIYISPAYVSAVDAVGTNYTFYVETDYHNGTIDKVWGFAFDLTYNPNVLECAEVVNGDLIDETTMWVEEFNNTEGTLHVSNSFYTGSGDPPVTDGPGTLANITFTVVALGTSNITFVDRYTRLIGFEGGEEYNIIDDTPIGHIEGASLDSSSTSTRDVAVTDVTTFKTVVTQDLCMFIDATVENQGASTEAGINVTAYANETAIQSTIIPSLASGANTTVTLTWNATGFAKGKYTISATADPVPGETDTADNTLVDGEVTVSCKGDITGPTPNVPDGTVNMRDISLVAKGFGANLVTDPASPKYGQYWHGTPCAQCPHNANCDLTSSTPGLPDGTINMRDIALVAKLFGTGGC